MHPLLRHSAAALGALALSPVAAGGLLLRPAWREGWRERLGSGPGGEPGSLWVHAASVGEALAAVRLLDAASERGWKLRASTTTATGRDVLRRVRPSVPVGLAPLDHPWVVERALARARPRALVLIETELWPCWIAAAHRRGTPVVVVSGRISDRSLPRYRRLRRLLAPTFARLAGVGARSANDAERFVALGTPAARVRVTGDLKLEPPTASPPPAPELAQACRVEPLLVAASTHPGEEEIVLDAFDRLEQRGGRAALLLAPRRPERADEVERLVTERGRKVLRRTRLAGETVGHGEVLLLDTLGELPALLGAAAVVFVGGTLVPVGGHNLVEPAHAGRPVLFGPRHEAVRESAEALLRARGGRVVRDADELAQGWLEWGVDREQSTAAGGRARGVVEAHRGATGRSLEWIEALLAREGGWC